ncbi:hypothetical protein Glove_198g56 [Diversispora epigaea]|uniref:Uncharacterized protein n=1 Tax=Diversispora epigaea TaxID=1348612 RepID=A0A397IRN2_9GLOM|nr:hypothetical protein Glove_198g56 [Diversispora epigaea]
MSTDKAHPRPRIKLGNNISAIFLQMQESGVKYRFYPIVIPFSVKSRHKIPSPNWQTKKKTYYTKNTINNTVYEWCGANHVAQTIFKMILNSFKMLNDKYEIIEWIPYDRFKDVKQIDIRKWDIKINKGKDAIIVNFNDVLNEMLNDKYEIIEWIPYDRFKDVKQIGNGGLMEILENGILKSTKEKMR